MAYSLTLQDCACNTGHPELIYPRTGEEQGKRLKIKQVRPILRIIFYSILLNEYTFTTYFSPKWCVQAKAQCCKKTHNWHSNRSELLPGWCNFTPVTAHIFSKSEKNRPGVVSLLVAFRPRWHARWVYSMPLWNAVPAEAKPRTHLRRSSAGSATGLRLQPPQE